MTRRSINFVAIFVSVILVSCAHGPSDVRGEGNSHNESSALVVDQDNARLSNQSDQDWANLPRVRCVRSRGKAELWFVTAKEGAVWIVKPGESPRILWNGGAECLDFVDENNGWIVDKTNRIHITTNAGRTWTVIAIDQTVSAVRDLQFADTASGWMIDSFNLFFTVDGGSTWKRGLPTARNPVRGQPNALHVRNGAAVRMCDSSGWVYGTPDRESRWFAKQVFTTNSALCEIFFVDNETGWYASGRGKLFKSEDGGQNWNKVETVRNDVEVRSMYWVSVRNGYLAGLVNKTDNTSPKHGSSILLRTSDGGLTWTKVEVPDVSPFFSDIFFVTTSTGYVVSRDSIYSTTDGGATWTEVVKLEEK